MIGKTTIPQSMAKNARRSATSAVSFDHQCPASVLIDNRQLAREPYAQRFACGTIAWFSAHTSSS